MRELPGSLIGDLPVETWSDALRAAAGPDWTWPDRTSELFELGAHDRRLAALAIEIEERRSRPPGPHGQRASRCGAPEPLRGARRGAAAADARPRRPASVERDGRRGRPADLRLVRRMRLAPALRPADLPSARGRRKRAQVDARDIPGRLGRPRASRGAARCSMSSPSLSLTCTTRSAICGLARRSSPTTPVVRRRAETLARRRGRAAGHVMTTRSYWLETPGARTAHARTTRRHAGRGGHRRGRDRLLCALALAEGGLKSQVVRGA